MTHAWSEGSDHGLAWPGVCALIEGALPQDAATAVWHHPQAAAGVRGFVTALQDASGLDWWSLPNFAAAFAVADGWRVVVRGPWIARWSGGELSGAAVSTWAEALVPRASGPVELGEDSPTLLRPLVAGVVPACRLRVGVEGAESTPVFPGSGQDAASDPVPGSPVERAAEESAAEPSEQIADDEGPHEQVMDDARPDEQVVDVDRPSDEVVAPVAPARSLPWWASQAAVVVEPAGSEAASDEELAPERPAEPELHGEDVPHDDSDLLDESETSDEAPAEEEGVAVGHDDGMTLLPGDEPEPTSLPDVSHDLAGPHDSDEDDEDDVGVGLSQPDDDQRDDRLEDEPDDAPAEPEPASPVSGFEPPQGAMLQGRFARQYGDTMVVSVEEAAVREDAEMIDSVPGHAPATAEAQQGERSDDVEEPAAAALVGDHDGATMLASSTPIPAPVPVSDADRVDERSETSDGVPLVLAALCEHGHPNPPERPTCTVCGAPVAGETVRVPRPSLGTLLLSDGRRVDLTAPVIVGRSPRAERFTGSLAPQLVPLSHSHISGLHLEIQLEGWRAMAVDLRSTNGTYLRREGEAPARLSERPEPLLAGDVLDLGHGVTITVEALR